MAIPVLRPSMTEREVSAVAEVMRSGWLGNGLKCLEFEKRLADRYAYRNCVTVNSGTAALHLACLTSGIGPGDEVIVPALTFISTALAVSYCGARPVFADIYPDTLCIDWGDVRRKTNGRTKAVIPVDYAGYCACMNEDRSWPVPLIQDAAHFSGGFGYGDEVCFSFHAVKNLAMGDGGAILPNDYAKAERMRALRWCGIDRSTWQRSGKRYGWDYDIKEVGYKCHLSDIMAAIGLVQLDRLDEMNERRCEIAYRYSKEFAGIGDIQLPANHVAHTHHLYVIRVDADKRDTLIDHLAENGISAGVHYRPITTYSIYADQPTPPVTEREWHRLVSLPIFPDLTEEDQGRVIEAVRGFFR